MAIGDLYRRLIRNLVTSSAIIREMIIPIDRVTANPRTIDVPIMNSIDAVSRVDTFEAQIELHARLNPVSAAVCNIFPFFSSSFIRSNIRTFASTAIPIERIIPAIPARVKTMY